MSTLVPQTELWVTQLEDKLTASLFIIFLAPQVDKILNYIICFINKSQLCEYVDLILYREVLVTLQHVCQSHQTLNTVHVRVETTRLHCSQSGLMGEAK